MSSESPATPPKTHRVVLVVCVLAIGAVGLAVSGIADRAKSTQEVAAWTNAQTVPTVRVVRPERGSGEQELILPGNVAAFITGSLYARASGYITAWNKDIGARVANGEILAAIQQAQASADLGHVTDQRTSQLVAQGWQSKQQGDTDRLNAASLAAAV